jgi:hypothetical protein
MSTPFPCISVRCVSGRPPSAPTTHSLSKAATTLTTLPHSNRHREAAPPIHLSERNEVAGALLSRDLPGSLHRRLAPDEEGTGSDPAHHDHKTAGHTSSGDLRCAIRLSRCPILGVRWERTGLLAGRILANSRLSNGTADAADSAAR